MSYCPAAQVPTMQGNSVDPQVRRVTHGEDAAVSKGTHFAAEGHQDPKEAKKHPDPTSRSNPVAASTAEKHEGSPASKDGKGTPAVVDAVEKHEGLSVPKGGKAAGTVGKHEGPPDPEHGKDVPPTAGTAEKHEGSPGTYDGNGVAAATGAAGQHEGAQAPNVDKEHPEAAGKGVLAAAGAEKHESSPTPKDGKQAPEGPGKDVPVAAGTAEEYKDGKQPSEGPGKVVPGAPKNCEGSPAAAHTEAKDVIRGLKGEQQPEVASKNTHPVTAPPQAVKEGNHAQEQGAAPPGTLGAWLPL